MRAFECVMDVCALMDDSENASRQSCDTRSIKGKCGEGLTSRSIDLCQLLVAGKDGVARDGAVIRRAELVERDGHPCHQQSAFLRASLDLDVDGRIRKT